MNLIVPLIGFLILLVKVQVGQSLVQGLKKESLWEIVYGHIHVVLVGTVLFWLGIYYGILSIRNYKPFGGYCGQIRNLVILLVVCQIYMACSLRELQKQIIRTVDAFRQGSIDGLTPGTYMDKTNKQENVLDISKPLDGMGSQMRLQQSSSLQLQDTPKTNQGVSGNSSKPSLSKKQEQAVWTRDKPTETMYLYLTVQRLVVSLLAIACTDLLYYTLVLLVGLIVASRLANNSFRIWILLVILCIMVSGLMTTVFLTSILREVFEYDQHGVRITGNHFQSLLNKVALDRGRIQCFKYLNCIIKNVQVSSQTGNGQVLKYTGLRMANNPQDTVQTPNSIHQQTTGGVQGQIYCEKLIHSNLKVAEVQRQLVDQLVVLMAATYLACLITLEALRKHYQPTEYIVITTTQVQ